MRASSTGLLLMGKLLWSLQSGSHSCPRPALDVAIDTLDAPVAKLRRSEGGGGRCLDALRLGAPVQGESGRTRTRGVLQATGSEADADVEAEADAGGALLRVD